MPFARLIFFPEPVELTLEQIEEARILGHLAEDPPGETPAPPAPPYTPSPAAPAGDQPEEG